MAQSAGSYQTEQAQLQLEERWAVYLINDDYTAFEWVQAQLVRIFHQPPHNAYETTLSVHQTGEGIAGIYDDRGHAEMLAKLAMKLSRENHFPLMCQVRPYAGEE